MVNNFCQENNITVVTSDSSCDSGQQVVPCGRGRQKKETLQKHFVQKKNETIYSVQKVGVQFHGIDIKRRQEVNGEPFAGAASMAFNPVVHMRPKGKGKWSAADDASHGDILF